MSGGRIVLEEGSPGGGRELQSFDDAREALLRRDELRRSLPSMVRRVYRVIDTDQVDGAPDAPASGEVEWCEGCEAQPALPQRNDGFCSACQPDDNDPGVRAAALFGRLRCSNCGERAVARSSKGVTSRAITERVLREASCMRCGNDLVLDPAYLSRRA